MIRDIYNRVSKFLPAASPTARMQFIGDAYMDLLSLDCAAHILYNQEDMNFPYPILYPFNPEAVMDPVSNASADWAKNWDNSGLSDKVQFPLDVNWLVNTVLGQYPLYKTFNTTTIPVKIRKVINVFTFKNIDTMSEFSEIFRPINGVYTLFDRYSFVKVPFTQEEGTADTPCKLTFFHPLNKINYPYFIEAYFIPEGLGVSPNAKSFIDTIKWKQALIDGAIGYAEDVENGDSKKMAKFEQYWKPKYKRENSKNTGTINVARFPTRFI